MANKPKPPPLDGAETEPTEHGPHGAAEHDIPAATSGKATAADADATARDAAIEARDAAAAGARRDDDEDRRRPRRTRVEREEDDDRPRALINNAAGVFVARPDPTKPISLTAPVVNGNWCGQYQGKQAHVKHGTPIEDLPSELQQLIVETRGQVVGPLPPKPQQNPFTP
jgi:hypothetical protein